MFESWKHVKAFVMTCPGKAQQSTVIPAKPRKAHKKTSKGQESPARPSKAQQSLAKAKPKKALVMTRPGKHS